MTSRFCVKALPPACSGEKVSTHERKPDVNDTPDGEVPSRRSDLSVILV